MPVTLRFESALAVSPATLWQHIISPAGIHDEMRPWLHMRFPPGLQRIDEREITLGSPLFSCWLLVLGVVPVGRSQLTFNRWQPGVGFTERSPMTGMRQWQHTRSIHVHEDGARLVDELVFEPLLLSSITRAIVRHFFRHRHRRLRRRFQGQ